MTEVKIVHFLRQGQTNFAGGDDLGLPRRWNLTIFAPFSGNPQSDPQLIYSLS